MNPEELREKALASGYRKIQLEAEGAQPVHLRTWRGISRGRPGGPGEVGTATVDYQLAGKRVRVQKALEGHTWYILS